MSGRAIPMVRDVGGDWIERRACVDVPTRVFFIERGASSREAKELCAGCPVRPECLEYALTNQEAWGIWGGTTERERRRLRSNRTRVRKSLERPASCGTDGGYRRHIRSGQPACDSCKAAHAHYSRQWDQTRRIEREDVA